MTFLDLIGCQGTIRIDKHAVRNLVIPGISEVTMCVQATLRASACPMTT